MTQHTLISKKTARLVMILMLAISFAITFNSVSAMPIDSDTFTAIIDQTQPRIPYRP